MVCKYKNYSYSTSGWKYWWITECFHIFLQNSTMLRYALLHTQFIHKITDILVHRYIHINMCIHIRTCTYALLRFHKLVVDLRKKHLESIVNFKYFHNLLFLNFKTIWSIWTYLRRFSPAVAKKFRPGGYKTSHSSLLKTNSQIRSSYLLSIKVIFLKIFFIRMIDIYT